jgi:hypothetical protein
MPIMARSRRADGEDSPQEPALAQVFASPTLDAFADVAHIADAPARGATVASGATPAAAPRLDGSESLVLSATARRLFTLGGSDGQAWMLDIDRRAWTPFTLAALRGQHILSFTFRFDDGSIYAVADDARDRVRLWRWSPGQDPQPVARLPRAWAALERAWLVADADGDLIFAGTRPRAPRGETSLFARIRLPRRGHARWPASRTWAIGPSARLS